MHQKKLKRFSNKIRISNPDLRLPNHKSPEVDNHHFPATQIKTNPGKKPISNTHTHIRNPNQNLFHNVKQVKENKPPLPQEAKISYIPFRAGGLLYCMSTSLSHATILHPLPEIGLRYLCGQPVSCFDMCKLTIPPTTAAYLRSKIHGFLQRGGLWSSRLE